jgi:hypothetical protein
VNHGNQTCRRCGSDEALCAHPECTGVSYVDTCRLCAAAVAANQRHQKRRSRARARVRHAATARAYQAFHSALLVRDAAKKSGDPQALQTALVALHKATAVLDEAEILRVRVEQLQAERDEARAECEAVHELRADAEIERDELRAEVERLRVSVSKLERVERAAWALREYAFRPRRPVHAECPDLRADATPCALWDALADLGEEAETSSAEHEQQNAAAEVERLRAVAVRDERDDLARQVTSLGAELIGARGLGTRLVGELREARAEVERLRGEHEELRVLVERYRFTIDEAEQHEHGNDDERIARIADMAAEVERLRAELRGRDAADRMHVAVVERLRAVAVAARAYLHFLDELGPDSWAEAALRAALRALDGEAKTPLDETEVERLRAELRAVAERLKAVAVKPALRHVDIRGVVLIDLDALPHTDRWAALRAAIDALDAEADDAG